MSLQGGIWLVGGQKVGRSRWRIVVVEEGENVGEEEEEDTKVNFGCGHISGSSRKWPSAGVLCHFLNRNC